MSRTYEQVMKDSREYAAEHDVREASQETPLEKRIDSTKASIAGLKIVFQELREGVSALQDLVNKMYEKSMESTAMRKSLNVGDEYSYPTDPEPFRKDRAEAGLHRYVSNLLASPQMPSRNGHAEEDD